MFNLYHSLGKFSRWGADDIFLIFARKCLDNLHTLSITVKAYFSGEKNKEEKYFKILSADYFYLVC